MGPGFFKGVVLGAATATVTLSAAAAFAGSGVGGVFNLGTSNSVSASTKLTGSTASAASLQVSNPSGGTAASFGVKTGQPPFTVSSNKQVGKLNVEYLQGHHARDFLAPVKVVAVNALVPPNAYLGELVTCPANSEAISGGGTLEDHFSLQTIESFPYYSSLPAQGTVAPATAWVTRFFNTSGSTSYAAQAYAICAPLG